MSKEHRWGQEEDRLLVNAMRQVGEVYPTRLAAFADVARQVERTPAAVGYRWNATLSRLEEVRDLRQTINARRRKYVTTLPGASLEATRTPSDSLPEQLRALEARVVQLEARYDALMRLLLNTLDEQPTA